MQYSRATCLARDYTFPSAKLQLYSVFTKFICRFSEIFQVFILTKTLRFYLDSSAQQNYQPFTPQIIIKID